MNIETLSLEVEEVSVNKGGRFIVKDASLAVQPGEFVIILGPNGAGKTTLLKAISGERPYSGMVRLNGSDLYAAPEWWLKHVGNVPSDNVLHENLTVRQALTYTAQLRLPDLSPEAREQRIEELLREFELPAHRWDALISKLSTGERRRANICAELLGEPPLLLLDEPTSGLDPHGERLVIEKLRYRADQHQRAVLITSHTVSSLEYGSRIVFMANGRVVQQGSSEQSVLDAMEANNWPEAYERHKTMTTDQPRGPGTQWVKRLFNQNPRSDTQPSEDRKNTDGPPADGNSRKDILRQCTVLMRRNWRIFWNESWWKRGIVFLLGPFASLLFALVLERESFIKSLYLYEQRYPRVLDIANLRNAVYLLALIITLLGLTGSFREIANEIHIYRHERLKGLSPAAYLSAKMTWLVPIFGLAMPLLLLGTLLRSQVFPPDGVLLAPTTEGIITLILASTAAVTLGLALSAIGSTRENATIALAIAIVCNALLAGLEKNQQWKDLTDRLSAVTSSRWTMEGVATSLKVYCWSNPLFKDYPSVGHIASVWLFLLVYILVTVMITYSALRAKDSWTRARLRNMFARGQIPVLILVLILMLAGWALRSTSSSAYDLRTDKDATVEEIVVETRQPHGMARLSVAFCPEEELTTEADEDIGTITLPTSVPGVEIRPKTP